MVYIIFAAEYDDSEITKIFLSEIAAATRRKFDSLCISAIKNSELNRVLSKIKSISLNSKICLLDFKTGNVLFDISNPTFFECGLNSFLTFKQCFGVRTVLKIKRVRINSFLTEGLYVPFKLNYIIALFFNDFFNGIECNVCGIIFDGYRFGV